MKNSILENQLKKLYLFGIITEKEFWRLLKKYQKEGLSEGLKIETLSLLEKSLKHYETEEEKVTKKEDFLKKHLKDLDIHHKKQIDDIKGSLVENRMTKMRDIRRRQNKRLTDIAIELSQLERKIRGYQNKATQELDRQKIADIRKIIQ
ncbi:MAG: hypothetical protein WC437_03380 [Patescibacteria group bacterium]|jgi:hypothetical protein|nr:hypothetical protein [Patescibacteria group bacterium]